MEIIVKHNQSLLDFAIQHTGTPQSVLWIAITNNISISDTLQAGTFLLLPDDAPKDMNMLNYFSEKNIQPATATSLEAIENQSAGIGNMVIGSNFMVY